ncbi:MAG: MaoC family dehydratase N-terminal domain-containing protein [Chloroflexota bacterium]|nr:MaoC family dehydratase N-terminal domain-containing protein [Chloroflexota bacterium]
MSSVAGTLVEPLSEEQIAALPTYDWDVAEVGHAAPPFTFAVTEEAIARYCLAVRNENPLFVDPKAAAAGPFGGIIAPPPFAFMCSPLRRNEVMHAQGYAAPEEKAEYQTPYAKAELFPRRQIRPGDEITSVVSLEEKYERRGNKFITWRVRAADARGEPVHEYTYTIIWRQAPRDQNAPARPGPAANETPAPIAAEDTLPTITKLESQEAIDRYGELTRVRPRVGANLHTDQEFARRTIFGGTANMGVATLAYCSELLERAYGPAALLRPGARIEYKGIRPIQAGDEITPSGRVVERRVGAHDCEIRVFAQDGTLRGLATATVIPD